MHNKQQIAKQKMEDIQKVSSTSGSSKDSESSNKSFKKNKQALKALNVYKDAYKKNYKKFTMRTFKDYMHHGNDLIDDVV